jgi:sortase family protein
VGPGAFYDLARLKVGDKISVLARFGRRTTWTVSAPPVTVAKGALPGSLFATTGPPRLALVTYGGSFDPATGHYRDNVIVWAKPARASQQ